VRTKNDGSTNIQNTLVPMRKMMISTVKNQYSVLLFHTNPLPFTILNNISMKTVSIGGLLSLTLG
jgi:predicted solute-binding protein